MIDVRKVFKALHTFIAMENPHYEGILEDDDFKQRCRETDPEGFKVLYPEETIDLSTLIINSQTAAAELELSGLNICSQNKDSVANDQQKTQQMKRQRMKKQQKRNI